MVFNNFNFDFLFDDFKVNNGYLIFKGYLCIKFGFLFSKSLGNI